MTQAPPIRLGLVGTGTDLFRAIKAFHNAPGVELVVVADADDQSGGAKLAQSLKLPLVKNARQVFKTQANVVAEVSGDERQYEQLLSIKPSGVEVIGALGAGLLIRLLEQVASAVGGEGRR